MSEEGFFSTKLGSTNVPYTAQATLLRKVGLAINSQFKLISQSLDR